MLLYTVSNASPSSCVRLTLDVLVSVGVIVLRCVLFLNTPPLYPMSFSKIEIARALQLNTVCFVVGS